MLFQESSRTIKLEKKIKLGFAVSIGDELKRMLKKIDLFNELIYNYFNLI